MADSNISITAGSGTTVDTRTVGSEHRQVVVIGDPDTNANVADIQNEDPGSSSTAQGMVVRLAGSATVVGLQGTTARPFLMNTDGAIKVYDVVNGTISTITRVDRVFNIVDGTISIGNRPDIQRVHNVIDGTMIVRDVNSTAVLPVTASSTSSAVSVSGGTVISPVVGSVIKVFAFSLTTTAQVHLAARFTNGAGTGPTEFWRVALQAPSAGIAGANLAVTPPGYLWATAAGSTLSLVLDSASLVHYSVAYFRESA